MNPLSRFFHTLTDDPAATGGSDIARALLAERRPGARLVLYGCVALLLGAILWMRYATLDIIARGEGKVEAASLGKPVQSLEGGIVREILVKEGQIVTEGQVLVRLDTTAAGAGVAEVHGQWLGLAAAAARHAAEARGENPRFPAEVLAETPDLVAAEAALFAARRRQIQEELAAVTESLRLVQQELTLSEPLVKAGAMAAVDILRLRRQLTELGMARAERQNRFRAEAQAALAAAEVEMSRLEAQQTAWRDRVQRAEMRAPVRAVVKKLHVTAPGAVVQGAAPVVELVPLDDPLMVEVRLKPNDIAFVVPGQKATIKISAYDFALYGGLEGEVVHVSPDSQLDERTREPYFLVRVKAARQWLGDAARPLPISIGMTAQADILTGKRTVMDYLLKPLLRLREGAFTER